MPTRSRLALALVFGGASAGGMAACVRDSAERASQPAPPTTAVLPTSPQLFIATNRDSAPLFVANRADRIDRPSRDDSAARPISTLWRRIDPLADSILVIAASPRDLELLSRHPLGSYVMIDDGATTRLKVLDAGRFWATSPLLVVAIDR